VDARFLKFSDLPRQQFGGGIRSPPGGENRKRRRNDTADVGECSLQDGKPGSHGSNPLVYCRCFSSFLIFFASFFSFMVFAGSFLAVFLLSWPFIFFS
jgi:hypothetical protein